MNTAIPRANSKKSIQRKHSKTQQNEDEILKNIQITHMKRETPMKNTGNKQKTADLIPNIPSVNGLNISIKRDCKSEFLKIV